jgi:gluconolactonase
VNHFGIPQVPAQDLRLVAEGLQRPEGPVALGDGRVLVVELDRGALTMIDDNGASENVARCGGAPNGAALGPDGAIYVCNNGGRWPDEYVGGSIQRVELGSGTVDVLYTSCDDHDLRGPNDLVFDSDGHFWFTDTGKFRARDRDHGGIYYASIDGATIVEAAHPVDAPNGIGLSPDGRALYYAETITARLYRRAIESAGVLSPAMTHDPGTLVCSLPGIQLLDSLALEENGNICVGTLVHGCITVIEPGGSVLEQVVLPESLTDPMVTNICFGGDDRRTAFLTLSETGRLVSCRWPRPGLALAW